MTQKKTLLLIDGSSYLFRAYYALPALTNSRGEQTGAVYGVMNMLRHFQKKMQASHVAVVFDSKGKTFRHKLYSDYKANRAEMPTDLQEQIKPLHKLVQDFGFPLLVKPGVEADDVIGSLARRALEQDYDVIISTGDKDFAQLVQPGLSLINTMTGVKLDCAGVEAKFGVPPQRIVDYLALIGDSVDNVPGVPKCGPKTALKWLTKYGSLDAVMQHADEVGGKVGENLRNSLEFLPLARDLVTIAQDIELDEQIDDLVMQPQQRKRILKAVQHLEFRTWSKEFADAEPADTSGLDQSGPGQLPASAQQAATHDASAKVSPKASQPEEEGGSVLCATGQYSMITTSEELQAWVKQLQRVNFFAIDTETTSLDVMQAQLVGISIAYAKGKAAYIPLQHDTDQPQLSAEQVLAALKPLLQDQSKHVIGQNLKYDYKVLMRAGLQITAPMWDTMLASYVLDSARRSNSLDAMAHDFLNYTTISYEQVVGKGAKQVCFSAVDLDAATQYAAEDADITWQLYEVLADKLHGEKCLYKVFSEIEMPMLRILADMELSGVLIDAAMLHQQSRSLARRMQALEKKIYTAADQEFNIASPKQLQEVLYDKLKLPVLKKTPTGQPSTAEPILQRLAADYPLPQQVLAYRSLSKLKSTYTDKLPQQIDAETEHVHTSYRQTGTTTGRLSSSDPNLQNIPIRSEDGRKVRQAFIAPRGYRLLAADYSQIELRLMAHFSGDHALLRAFEDDIDVHQATAAEVFAVPLTEVTSDMRRKAKAINFGLMYGMSAFGLSQQLDISRAQAAEFIETYFMRYPKVQIYMQKARDFAAEHGYVETLCGRRVMIPEAGSKQAVRRAAADRAAINAPLQGSSADIIKLAMLAVTADQAYNKLRAAMIMQVHDELVFCIHKDDCEKAKERIVSAMEHAVELKVPLRVSVGQGMNWDEAH